VVIWDNRGLRIGLPRGLLLLKLLVWHCPLLFAGMTIFMNNVIFGAREWMSMNPFIDKGINVWE
jgi:hypothetical protein